MFAFALALLASAWFVGFVADSGERIERERMQSLVRTAAATLESANVAALAGSSADVGTPAFDAIRDELRRVRDVNPDFRFVYLMRPAPGAPGKLAFLADAESPESPDYSAPGDVYDGPSEVLGRVFRTGIAQVALTRGHRVTLASHGIDHPRQLRYARPGPVVRVETVQHLIGSRRTRRFQQSLAERRC